MILSDLGFQSSPRNARRALREEAEQAARASSNLSPRPEDSATNIGLAMQEAMLGWPHQYAVPSTPRSTVSQQRLTISRKPLPSTVSQQQSTISRKPLPSTMAQSTPFLMHYPLPVSSVYSQPSQNPYTAITAANTYTDATPQYQQAQLSDQPWLHQPGQFMLPPPALPIPSPHPMAPRSEANVHPALRRIHTEPAAPSSSPSTSPTLTNPSSQDATWAKIEARGDTLQAKLDKAHKEVNEELSWREIGFRGRMKERWARNK